MNMIRNVKGTRDIVGDEAALWNVVEQCARSAFNLYGFGEIRTPILEDTSLFVRGVGESSDIVGKQMYTFDDRKGRSLSLRPESTAPVARAFVQHGMHAGPSPLRLYYIGPQFRYERPQKGRYRQFQQIGAEVLGDPGPGSDAELLVMLLRFLRSLDFSSLLVRLNTVGNAQARAAFGEALRTYLEPYRGDLGEDSQRRLETNPLRILDTKVPRERELLVDAPVLHQFLTEECREHFVGVRTLLDRFSIEYVVEPDLVRGLDYYTRTVFEIASSELGAQDAILGGGRYDGLVQQLGGPEVPSIGFAIGQDRLIDILPQAFRDRHLVAPPVVVIPIGLEEGSSVALEIAEELRDAGFSVMTELSGRAVKASLRQANRRSAVGAVLVGEDELADDAATFKNFATGEQRTVPRAGLVDLVGSVFDQPDD